MRAFLKKIVLYIGNFIAQYHFYLIAFIASSFLATFVGVENVGYIFAGSSAIVALLLYAAPRLFRSFGTRNIITLLGVAEVVTLLGLAVVTNATIVVILFIAQSVFAYGLFIGIDFLIEASVVRESATGSTRTSYLTLTNIAVLLASLSLSLIVVGEDYYSVFIISALVLIAFILYQWLLFPAISFAARDGTEGSVITALRADKSLRYITATHLLLQIFFSWMGIYLPILLFSYEGFGWSEIGIILAIAMLPYVLLEYPLGFIADKWLGEKEILTLGFIIVSLSLVGVPFFHGSSFWWWVALMLFSRIGAAAIEAMTEVHFFRHVTEKDTDIITAFRVLRPVGSILGPLVASAALMVFVLPYAFPVFALIMIAGIPLSMSIVDSK